MISVLSTLEIFRKTQVFYFFDLFLVDLCASLVGIGQMHKCPEVIGLLFQEYIPDLYNHFLDISLEAHMYASQWFLTLFTAKFPLYMVFHIIDLLLCEVCIRGRSTLAFVCSVLENKSCFESQLCQNRIGLFSYFILLLGNLDLSDFSLD